MEVSLKAAILVWIFSASTGIINSLFVPEQLPTLLSFVYTNIPPIRKGIDSRVGFGFRLGPNADVQVMLELGPQQNTVPVGPPKSDGNSKRETRPQPYKFKAPAKGSWLQAWRQQQALVDEGEDVGVMPAQPAMDKDIVAHLHQLYKQQPDNREAKMLQPANSDDMASSQDDEASPNVEPILMIVSTPVVNQSSSNETHAMENVPVDMR